MTNALKQSIGRGQRGLRCLNILFFGTYASLLTGLATTALALNAGLDGEFRSQAVFVPPNVEGPPTERQSAARAAGLRALHICTGLFTAGLDEARLEADIPGAARTPSFQTVVDRKAGTVSVSYVPDMPPRIAVWRPLLGCTQLPVGAAADDAQLLRRPTDTMKAPDFDARAWPQGDRGALAEPSGPERSALHQVITAAFDARRYGGATWGVVVLQNGKIRAEQYASAYDLHTPARTNSMCKSLAATLIGVGVRQNLVDLHRSTLREWTKPGDPRGAITLDNLLHMASGLYSESGGNPQPYLYYGGAAAAERAALNVLDRRPGTRFQYAGADTILAVRFLRQAYANEDAWPTFPHRELLWKIGMTRTTLEMDWQGDFLISGDCWSTARDFARLGLLYLNNGVWNGERILPEDWTKYVATPAATNRRYGAHFWLFGGLSGLSDDVYGAFGAQGQYALIVPSRNMVVVRRGLDGQRGDFDMPQFTADIIAALNR